MPTPEQIKSVAAYEKLMHHRLRLFKDWWAASMDKPPELSRVLTFQQMDEDFEYWLLLVHNPSLKYKLMLPCKEENLELLTGAQGGQDPRAT